MSIPVLDWSRFADPDGQGRFVAELGAACRGPGFFLLTNHGLPQGLVDETFAAADQFFALPAAEKARCAISLSPHNRGWAGLGAEKLDETSAAGDRKEAFNVGLDLSPEDPRVRAGEPFRGVNLWPDLPGFRETLLEYFDRAAELAGRLHQAIALDLGLPRYYFEPCFDAPMATLRVLSYPPAAGDAPPVAAGAHTDYGSITLLLSDGVPGLQVRPRDGDWIDAPHVPGGLIVNIGDCLMRWTNDIYVSTPHRVLAPTRHRRSIVFFFDPNPDAMIAALPGVGPAKYPPVTGAEYLRSRLDATYKPEEGR